jgi:hypothetical protein
MAEVYFLELPSSSPPGKGPSTDTSALWWTSRDYKLNKNRYRAMARRLMTYGSSEGGLFYREDDADYRGLERMLDDGHSRAQIYRAVHAVQAEQARHFLDGVVEDSDLVLAEVYSAHCIASAAEAERLGRLDAIEATEALQSEWDSDIPPTACCDSDLESFSSDGDNNDDTLFQPDEMIASTTNPVDPFASEIFATDNNATIVIADKKVEKETPFVIGKPNERRLFQTNFRFSISNVMNRRPHAWI